MLWGEGQRPPCTHSCNSLRFNWTQCLSDLKVHTNHLRILLKIQILTQQVWGGLPKLLGDAQAAGQSDNIFIAKS